MRYRQVCLACLVLNRVNTLPSRLYSIHVLSPPNTQPSLPRPSALNTHRYNIQGALVNKIIHLYTIRLLRDFVFKFIHVRYRMVITLFVFSFFYSVVQEAHGFAMKRFDKSLLSQYIKSEVMFNKPVHLV